MSVKFVWYGHKALKASNAMAVNVVFETMEVCLQEANRLCPLDTGALMMSGEVNTQSGEVKTTNKSGGVAIVSRPSPMDTPRGTISYGNGGVPYAVRLHEHPEYHFQGGRVGKWLETTIREKCNNIFDKVCRIHNIDQY
jgi:hypothetical protein